MKRIEEQYERKSQKEHILFRPDMYMGSIVSQKTKMWLLDESQDKFQEREVELNPGLYKIFDEIIVNSADNYQKDNKTNKIKVSVTNKQISVYNNGKGLPIQVHKKENM
jgi:DNA topoisomerase-2